MGKYMYDKKRIMATNYKSDEREEGEIVDDLELIVSSEEETQIYKRIIDLEEKNDELKKIDNISENVSNKYGYKKKLSVRHSKLVRSKKRGIKSNKKHIKFTKKKSQRYNYSKKRKQLSQNIENFDSSSSNSLKLSDSESIHCTSCLNREKLRFALKRNEFKSKRTLKERLLNEKVIIPGNAIENKNNDIDNSSANTSDSLEEQELRLIALKSAIMKKHLARKQRNAEIAYSPTDFENNFNQNFKAIDDQMDLVDEELESLKIETEVSPVSSPKLSPNPYSNEESLSANMPPVNMEINFPENENECLDQSHRKLSIIDEKNIYFCFTHDQVPPSHPLNLDNSSIHQEIQQTDCVKDNILLSNSKNISFVSNLNNNSNNQISDEEEEALRTLLLSKFQPLKTSKNFKNSKEDFHKLVKEKNLSQSDPIYEYMHYSPSESILKRAVRRFKVSEGNVSADRISMIEKPIEVCHKNTTENFKDKKSVETFDKNKDNVKLKYDTSKKLLPDNKSCSVLKLTGTEIPTSVENLSSINYNTDKYKNLENIEKVEKNEIFELAQKSSPKKVNAFQTQNEHRNSNYELLQNERTLDNVPKDFITKNVNCSNATINQPTIFKSNSPIAKPKSFCAEIEVCKMQKNQESNENNENCEKQLNIRKNEDNLSMSSIDLSSKKLNNNNMLAITNKPLIEVKKLVITLRESDSETTEDEFSKSRDKNFLQKCLHNLKPKSSKQDSFEQVFQRSTIPKVSVDELGKQDVGDFLENTSLKVQQNSINKSSLSTENESEFRRFMTPQAVHHLSKASQQEYLQLINRMNMLEERKQALRIEKPLKSSTEDNSSMLQNIQCKDERLLNTYETSLQKLSTGLLLKLNQSLQLVEKTKNAKLIKLYYNQELERLYGEVKEIQNKMKEEQRLISTTFPKICTLNETITKMNRKHVKMFETVKNLGTNLRGEHFRVNSEVKEEILKKSKKLALEIKTVNSLKQNDLNKFTKSLTSNNFKCLQEKIALPNKPLKSPEVNRNLKYHISGIVEKDFDKKIHDNCGTKIFDEKLIEVDQDLGSNPQQIKSKEETFDKMEWRETVLKKYVSPLMNFQHNGESNFDVHSVLCPFELMGDCKDEDCEYAHLTDKKKIYSLTGELLKRKST